MESDRGGGPEPFMRAAGLHQGHAFQLIAATLSRQTAGRHQRSAALQDVVWSTACSMGQCSGYTSACGAAEPGSTTWRSRIDPAIYAERGRRDASGALVYSQKSTAVQDGSPSASFAKSGWRARWKIVVTSGRVMRSRSSSRWASLAPSTVTETRRVDGRRGTLSLRGAVGAPSRSTRRRHYVVGSPGAAQGLRRRAPPTAHPGDGTLRTYLSRIRSVDERSSLKPDRRGAEDAACTLPPPSGPEVTGGTEETAESAPRSRPISTGRGT